jgi:hypothetical protein
MEAAVRGDRHDGVFLRLGLLGAVVRDRQRERHALLQKGRDNHHDDQQHEHHVNERRDVDVGLD